MLNSEIFKLLVEETTKVLSETDRSGDFEWNKYGNKAVPQRTTTVGLLPDKLDDNFFKLFGQETGVLMRDVKYVGVRLSDTGGKTPEMFFFDSNFRPASYAEIKNKGYRTLVIAEDGRVGEVKDGKFVSLVKESISIQSKRVLVDTVYEKLRTDKGLDPRHISVIYFFAENKA